VSWEEAYDYVYNKLKPLIDKYGPQTLATFMHGTRREICTLFNYGTR